MTENKYPSIRVKKAVYDRLAKFARHNGYTVARGLEEVLDIAKVCPNCGERSPIEWVSSRGYCYSCEDALASRSQSDMETDLRHGG